MVGHITSILSKEKQNPEPSGHTAGNPHHQDLGSRIDQLANLADVAQGSAATYALVDETAQQEFARHRCPAAIRSSSRSGTSSSSRPILAPTSELRPPDACRQPTSEKRDAPGPLAELLSPALQRLPVPRDEVELLGG